MDAVEFDALLDEMQTAALGLSLWDPVLASLSRLFGAHDVALHKDFWKGGGWGVRTGGDDRIVSDYVSYYAGIHPLAVRTMSAPAGTVLTDRMIMPRAEFERTEFYAGWVRPNGFDEQLHVRLDNDAHALVGLSVTRPRGAPEFDAAELTLAQRIAPHLRRAVATYERFQALGQTNAGLIGVLDRMRQCVFGLGADGRVVFANKAARAMLAQEDALRVENGLLAAAGAGQTRMIERMLGSIARGEAASVLHLERPDGRPPLQLEPVRLGGVASVSDLQPSLTLLLWVLDPEVETRDVVARLRERYGLTATEAAVAFHAARGKGVAAVATALAIGQGTVRSHLKRVFEKTGTHRQAELAWIIASSETTGDGC